MQIRPDEPNLLLIALIQKTIEFMSQALENKNDPSRYQLFQYSFADVHWKLCQRKLTYFERAGIINSCAQVELEVQPGWKIWCQMILGKSTELSDDNSGSC